MRELYWRKTASRRVQKAREGGMVPLKELDRRLSLRSIPRSEMRSEIRPESWRRGRRISVTRRFVQKTPRQSHGAEGVEGSHEVNAPSGSWRLSLNAVSASISG